MKNTRTQFQDNFLFFRISSSIFLNILFFLVINSLYFISCSTNEAISPVGLWKLTEELIDIGDGRGEFIKVDQELFIEFFPDGTFLTSVILCSDPIEKPEKMEGTYSTKDNRLFPNNCDENVSGITFEVKKHELILFLSCIETCKQKYVKID